MMKTVKAIVPADFYKPLPTPNPAIFANEKAEKTPLREPEPVKADRSKPAPGDLDDKQKPFDPSIHSGAKHPKYGHWMPKRGARKREQTTGDADREDGAADDAGFSYVPPSPDTEGSRDDGGRASGGVQINGKNATNMTHVLILKVFGKEGRLSAEEVMILEDCWNEVLKDTRIKLTPKKALGFAVLSIFATRLVQPCGEPALNRVFAFLGGVWNRVRHWRIFSYMNRTSRKADAMRNEQASEESS